MNVVISTRTALMSLILLGLTSTSVAHAEEASRWGMGAKLYATNWTVTNQDTDAESKAISGQLGLSGKYQKGRFYGGLAIQAGDFEFKDNAPAQPDGSASTAPTTIKHANSDLIFGYYFWQKVSLFIDIKNVSNEWEDGDKVEYSGIGYGINVVHPLSPRWAISGSFGLVPMRIKIDDKNVGDAGRSALDISLHYSLGPQSNLSISLKNQSQTDEYDNGLEQEHKFGALVLGGNIIF